MTGRKIPPEEAFSYYANLGPTRSYAAVAAHYHVSKRAITNLAKTHGWQERLERIDEEARQRIDERIVDAVEEMNVRHLKTLKVIQAKALQALQAMPLDSAMNAVRALEIAIRHERLIQGEPSERTATSTEDTIRREYERWMNSDPEPEEARNR